MLTQLFVGVIVSGALLITAAAPVHAGDESASDEWRFEVDPHLWAAGLGGASGNGFPISVGFTDILEDLNFAMMGSVKASKNKFSVFADTVYLKITGGSGSKFPLPIPPSLSISKELKASMKSWIATAGVGYKLIDSEQGSLNVHAGTRYLSADVKSTVTLTGPGPGQGVVVSGHEYWLDGIVGASGEVPLDNQKKWYFRYYGDLGTGDSDFTWATEGRIGYRLNDKWDAYAGYRYVGWNFESGDALADINARGPIFGAIYRF
jgi:hypothetical protein